MENKLDFLQCAIFIYLIEIFSVVNINYLLLLSYQGEGNVYDK